MNVCKIIIKDEILAGHTFNDVLKQYDKEAECVHVFIYSPGGDVNEGMAIFQWLKNLNIPVTTEVFGLCASIATVIFLAGKERIINEGSYFMIHNPSLVNINISLDDIDDAKTQLEDSRDNLLEVYAQNTRLSRSQLKDLMSKEAKIKAKELLAYGFATKIKKSATALYINNLINKKQMKKTRTRFSLRALRDLFLGVKALDLTLKDGTAVYVDTEEDMPKVGDVVLLKETMTEAPDGTHELEDGTRIITQGGIIIEIIEPLIEESESIQALRAMIENMQKELEAYKQKAEIKEKEVNKLRSMTSVGQAIKANDSKKQDIYESKTDEDVLNEYMNPFGYFKYAQSLAALAVKKKLNNIK